MSNAKQQGKNSYIQRSEQRLKTLYQELEQHDAALVPVAKALVRVDKNLIAFSKVLAEQQALLTQNEADASKVNPIVDTKISDLQSLLDVPTDMLDDIMDSLFGGDTKAVHRAYALKTIGEWQAHRIDVAPLKESVGNLEAAIKRYKAEKREWIGEQTEIEQRKKYEALAPIALEMQNSKISMILEHYAENHGTSLDTVLEKERLAKPFVEGKLTREALDEAVNWANEQKGDMGMLPEQMAFKQFINRTVIPHIGSFEAYASMVDDFTKADKKKKPPLELLREKPITFSGRKAVQLSDAPATDEAKKLAAGLLEDAAKMDKIISSSDPIVTRVVGAAKQNEKILKGFEAEFAGIEGKINDLIIEAGGKAAKSQAIAERVVAGKEKNERVDEQAGLIEFEVARREALYPKETPRTVRILEHALAYALGGATGGDMLGGPVGGVLGGLGGLAYGTHKGWNHVETHIVETNIKTELVGYLRSQKVDVEKHEAEIQAISKEITRLMKNKQFQEEVGSELKVLQIQNAYVARSLLRSGIQNISLLAESCEKNGIDSPDSFVNAFKGDNDMQGTFNRFCFGLANSNDMSLIMAEAAALSGGKLKPHERALKDFVEHVMKPDIGAYLSKASEVDVISQSNLLPYGAPLGHTKGIVRDENDPKLAALMANEFGMSVVGLQDVKHVFDFYLHRHGDKRLYDAKLKDGQMVDEYPEKRISVIPTEEVERFVDMTKQSMSHGRKTQPQVSDMFLRVCAHEYFMPQAVRTAGANNIFSENPEAPAAYPMVNATVNKFIQEMSLGPIQAYRQKVGVRLDNVIAQTFIDYFATLGAMHSDDKKITPTRRQLREAGNTRDYGPVFSAYTRKITDDSTSKFGLFMDIYKHNLQKHCETWPEEDRKTLEAHLAALPDPSKTMLTPEIVKPGSHRARLLAAYEDHSLENLSPSSASSKER